MEMDFQMYMNDIVTTARNDMDEAGYTQMRTVEDVEKQLSEPGTSVVFVNSVCGCAGGIARPAARHALDFDQLPDRLLTVFAGQDKEATEAVRAKAPDFIPSSPSFILFKDGKVVDMIERHNIEGHETMSVIMDLQSWFMEHGKAQ